MLIVRIVVSKRNHFHILLSMMTIFGIGSCVSESIPTQFDPALIEKAKSDIDTQYWLGTAFLHGDGVAVQLHQEAAYWFTRSASGGNSSAAIAMAKLFSDGGNFFPRNYQCASYWLEVAKKIDPKITLSVESQFVFPDDIQYKIKSVDQDLFNPRITMTSENSEYRDCIYFGSKKFYRYSFELKNCYSESGLKNDRYCMWVSKGDPKVTIKSK